jgi:hypothetical protein
LRRGSLSSLALALPPADVEPAEAAVARLWGRKPDRVRRYATASDDTALYAARWDDPFGEKRIRPVSWRPGEGWRIAASPASRLLNNLPAFCRRPAIPSRC